MTDKKLYAERDIELQGEYYFNHIMAMTGEDLYSKSDIAAELAHRDIQIDALKLEIKILENSGGDLSTMGTFARGEDNG